MVEHGSTVTRETSIPKNSWWMYVGGSPDGAVTILQVKGSYATGGRDSEWIVDAWYYSLNGTSQNPDYVEREIPTDLRPLTSAAFVEMARNGVLLPLVVASMTIITTVNTQEQLD